MNFHTQSEIAYNIDRIVKIINCGIFNPNNSSHPLRESAFIELMICVRDLMAKSEIFAERVSFSDDVNLAKGVEDVSDAISKIRNAVCHIDSPHREVGETTNRVSFSTMVGKGVLMKIGDIELTSEYEDDVCFFYGDHRLYLKRHIIRTFEEAKSQLVPLLDDHMRNRYL